MRSLGKETTLRLTALLVSASILLPATALAAGPSTDQCISANEDGAVLRKRGKLMSSKQSLAACISESCPKMVREDCLRTLNQLDREIPTIRFQAMEGTTEILDVRVLMDNAPLVEKLESGKSIAVDPGEHIFTFFSTGHPIQTRRVTLKEGEKDHVENVQLGGGTFVTTMGHLTVISEPGAGIVIDGARTLGRFDGVLPAGEHVIGVSKEGKKSVFLNIDVTAGEAKLDVKLQDEKKASYVPWLIGGAIVVGALLIGGGIAIAASK